MGLVLTNISIVSLDTFPKRGRIGYQDITPSEHPRIYSGMMILGKCFEGCTREHTTTLDQWVKRWSIN